MIRGGSWNENVRNMRGTNRKNNWLVSSYLIRYRNLPKTNLYDSAVEGEKSMNQTPAP